MKCPRCGKELPDSNVAIVCDGCGYQQNKLTKEDRRRIQQEKLQRLREERKQKSERPKAQKHRGADPAESCCGALRFFDSCFYTWQYGAKQ